MRLAFLLRLHTIPAKDLARQLWIVSSVRLFEFKIVSEKHANERREDTKEMFTLVHAHRHLLDDKNTEPQI